MGLPLALSTAAARAQERAAAAASSGSIGQQMLQELEDLVGDRVEEYDAVGVEIERMVSAATQTNIRHQLEYAELQAKLTREQAELQVKFIVCLLGGNGGAGLGKNNDFSEKL